MNQNIITIEDSEEEDKEEGEVQPQIPVQPALKHAPQPSEQQVPSAPPGTSSSQPPPPPHQSVPHIAPLPQLQEFIEKHSKPNIQFNATGQPILMLPRDGKILLLDVEGTTTNVSFVENVLLPYISRRVMITFLRQNVVAAKNFRDSMDQLQKWQRLLLDDLQQHGSEQDFREQHQLAMRGETESTATRMTEPLMKSIAALVLYMMEHQIRGKHLKELQGQVWKRGYEQGEIYGHVYDDVLPTFQWMAQQGIHIYLYSSASIQAQQLQFQYSTSGKLIHFLSGHYDLTNAGPKRNVESYKTIVTSLTAKFHRLQARDIVFVSDEDEELLAATKAGLQTVLSIRPGNNQCSGDALKRFAQVHSLLQLCGGDQLYWW